MLLFASNFLQAQLDESNAIASQDAEDARIQRKMEHKIAQIEMEAKMLISQVKLEASHQMYENHSKQGPKAEVAREALKKYDAEAKRHRDDQQFLRREAQDEELIIALGECAKSKPFATAEPEKIRSVFGLESYQKFVDLKYKDARIVITDLIAGGYKDNEVVKGMF